MSAEMWNSHPDGELYFDKCLDFLAELYQHFRDVKTKHTIEIVLFSRVAANQFSSTSATPTFRCLSPSANSKQKDTDYIHVISFADIFPFTLLQFRLKQYFKEWKSIVKAQSENTIVSSKNANVFESIVTTLHHFGAHFRGGSSETMLVITPGNGVLRTSCLIYSMCKKIVLKNYVNVQFVSLAVKPLFTTPLVLFTDQDAKKAFSIPFWVSLRFYQSFMFDMSKLSRAHSCKNCLTYNFSKDSDYFFVTATKKKSNVIQNYLIPNDEETPLETSLIKQSLLPVSGVSPLRVDQIPKEHSLAYCITESFKKERESPWDNLVKLSCAVKYISDVPTKPFHKFETTNYTITPNNGILPKQLFSMMIANRIALGFQFNSDTTSDTSTVLYAPDAIHMLSLKENGVDVQIQHKVYANTKLFPYPYEFVAIITPPLNPLEFNPKIYNSSKRCINLQPQSRMEWKVYDSFNSLNTDDENVGKFHSLIFHIFSKEQEDDIYYAFLQFYDFILSQSEYMVEWFPIHFKHEEQKKDNIDYFDIENLLKALNKEIHGKVSGTTLATWMSNNTNVVNRDHAKIVLNALVKRKLIVGPEGQSSFVDSKQIIYTTLAIQRFDSLTTVESRVQATQSPFHPRSFLVRLNCGTAKKENYFLEMEKIFDPKTQVHYHYGFYWLNVFMNPRTIDKIVETHYKHFEKNSDLDFVQQILPRDIVVMKWLDCKAKKTTVVHQNPINCKFQ
ncbi:dep domain containing protein, putative [Entamoeba invadens IP1]|uniref:Dep domain containing protein, putative n=1 Tax=Entamoeba invadens IP1 TaxID=370355 RepID=L7FLQ8_ENTIV|nr:dep domain containing protein, putative [Entamoeba invadens IP1]ELP84803.1 dep domain containing protein, putative [Entamoeba invadens IP1]|eukprot:XP_004184149.1 dep domain containing protein, putative [Entamoeba invadens IP1]